jgi:hypothetical protein
MNIKRTTTIELSDENLTEAVTLWARKKRLARDGKHVTSVAMHGEGLADGSFTAQVVLTVEDAPAVSAADVGL